MYGRINSYPGASDADEIRQSATNHAQSDADSQRFADMFAGMHIAAPRASSSEATPSYSLVRRPPVVELKSSEFEQNVKDFYGDEIEDIAAKSWIYSLPVSSKAARTAQVAHDHGTKPGSENARYFSYQLGNKSVGLLRTEGGASMSDVFKDEKARARWREQFPGRTELTSTVDFRVTHPLVENAGDILLEHQLRLDGERPLLLSHAVNDEAKARARALGFVEVSDSMMVLDPTKHPNKWTKNDDGEWQRKNKPPLYLKATDISGSDTRGAQRARNITPDWDDDDFM
ncbi:Effector protein NopP [Bradyrhizobium sp. WSM 1738]|uniref:Effector protein NopP n=1 Tax=Bradyrhizobium hereditatis TaxID=2821405 RepID=UPI001CE2FE1B|nr:Effector protein NopP [Bradyrhizobium hereditatis]MCA6115065.1 Effector protein NopP [Bradyrhizobium hereditatis]